MSARRAYGVLVVYLNSIRAETGVPAVSAIVPFDSGREHLHSEFSGEAIPGAVRSGKEGIDVAASQGFRRVGLSD